MFETRIPRNNASRHDPKVIVSTPKQNRIPLGIVSVLARTMLAYERLAARRGRRPRACLRRAASTSLNPVDVISPTVTIPPTLPDATKTHNALTRTTPTTRAQH